MSEHEPGGRRCSASPPARRRRLLLRVEGVTAYYGSIIALKGVDIDVMPGEIVTLIGANGAGKSTLMMTICGNPARLGGPHRVRWPRHHPSADARDRPAAHRPVAGGPAHLPAHDGAREPADGRTSFVDLRHFDEDLARVTRLFPRLKERIEQRGGTLSGGEQQMLAIARALMSRPKLLLLDEPSLGLAPLIVEQIFDAIRELNRRDGMTVFLVEQNAFHALKLAHRGYVMVNGLVTMSGRGDELLARPEIRAAYLEGGRH